MTQSRLLTIPQEIRNHIYKHYFDDSILHIGPRDVGEDAHGTRLTVSSNRSSILMACQQVYKEACVFYHEFTELRLEHCYSEDLDDSKGLLARMPPWVTQRLSRVDASDGSFSISFLERFNNLQEVRLADYTRSFYDSLFGPVGCLGSERSHMVVDTTERLETICKHILVPQEGCHHGRDTFFLSALTRYFQEVTFKIPTHLTFWHEDTSHKV
jgi:hypothetical protein